MTNFVQAASPELGRNTGNKTIGMITGTVEIKSNTEGNCYAAQKDARDQPCRRLKRFRVKLLLLTVLGMLLCHELFKAPLIAPLPDSSAPVEQPRLHYEWDGTRFVLTYEHLDSSVDSSVHSSAATTMSEHSPELVDSANGFIRVDSETNKAACDPETETMEVFGNDFRCLDMLDWCSQLSEYGHLANSCTCACWGLAQPSPAADR